MKAINTALVAGVLGGFLFVANAQQVNATNDPIFNDFIKMQKDMDAQFTNFHQKYFTDDKFFNQVDMNTKSDFQEDKTRYLISIDLPGFELSNIKLQTDGNKITVHATNDAENTKKDEHYYQRERMVGTVDRSYILPQNADMKSIKTEFKNGVYSISVVKK